MNANFEQIQKLTNLITEAQALIRAINEPAMTREGWSLVQPNGMPAKPVSATTGRNGCMWVPQESRDLVKAWLGFASVESMALRHRRTEGAIRSQLQHLLYSADVDAVLKLLVPVGVDL